MINSCLIIVLPVEYITLFSHSLCMYMYLHTDIYIYSVSAHTHRHTHSISLLELRRHVTTEWVA